LTLAAIDGLVLAIADILKSTVAVSLLSLHLPVDKPECVDVPREVSKDSQTDVDEQITAAARDERSSSGREKYRYNDEDNVGCFDHGGLLSS